MTLFISWTATSNTLFLEWWLFCLYMKARILVLFLPNQEIELIRYIHVPMNICWNSGWWRVVHLSIACVWLSKENSGYRESRPEKYSRAQTEHALELLKDYSYSPVVNMTVHNKATLVGMKADAKNPHYIS